MPTKTKQKKSFKQFYAETQDGILETNLRYALSEEFTDTDLINEIQLNEGIASSAAAVGLYFRLSNKLKKLDFSKPKDVGKGFGVLAQLIVLSQLAGGAGLKKILPKIKGIVSG